MLQFSDSAILYTITNLLEFAGVIISANNQLVIKREMSSVTVTIFSDKRIVFKLMPGYKVEQLLNGNLILDKTSSFDSSIKIPVFFAENNLSFASIKNGDLIIHADIVTISFLILSRFEETLIAERDEHNRFLFKNSLSYKYDFIDIPLVDEYAMLLMIWISRFIPSLKLCKKKGRVIPTHDIDYFMRFGNTLKNLKTIIGGDLLKNKSLLTSLKSIKQCYDTSKNSLEDPLILAIKRLIDISKRKKLNPIFYFKALKKNQEDCTYDIFMPEVKYCIDKIKDEGMKIGIHGSYHSLYNEIIFGQEKENLESVFGEIIKENRQHYLRFDIKSTVQILQMCGITDDSTLGFAEREGFRCGTCHEYFLFDFKNNCTSTVREHPLIVMDTTLLGYRKMDEETAFRTIERLYKRCQLVGGDFVLLWHNTNIIRSYEKFFEKVYCRFMDTSICDKV